MGSFSDGPILFQKEFVIADMIQIRENLIIKKDFMGLVAGDEVELIFADSYGELHFEVINRTRLVRFQFRK
jgi:hypothetical protein